MEKNFVVDVRDNAGRVQAEHGQQTKPDLEKGRESKRGGAD